MENLLASKVLNNLSPQWISKTLTGGFKVFQSRTKLIAILVKNSLNKTPEFIQKLKEMHYEELQQKVMNEVFGVKFNSNVEIYK